MLSREFYISLIGYGGGSLSIIAYVLITNNFINSDSVVYLALNLVSGLSLMIYTFTKKAYANTVLNSIWFLISILAFARLIY